MKQSPPGGFVTVSGLQTHVVVSGGGPTVVLCGGLGSDWFNWAALIEDFVRLAQHLKARFTVVTEAHHHAMIDRPAAVAVLIPNWCKPRFTAHVTCPFESAAQDPSQSSAMAR